MAIYPPTNHTKHFIGSHAARIFKMSQSSRPAASNGESETVSSHSNEFTDAIGPSPSSSSPVDRKTKAIATSTRSADLEKDANAERTEGPLTPGELKEMTDAELYALYARLELQKDGLLRQVLQEQDHGFQLSKAVLDAFIAQQAAVNKQVKTPEVKTPEVDADVLSLDKSKTA